jgi:uncharacterized protein (TIGR02118 family)
MRRLTALSLLALAAACSKPDARPAQDTTAQAPAGPMAFVTVIYNLPKDAAAFEKYYWDTHVPLVGNKQAEVGFVQAELSKFDATLDGKAPTHYRQAVLWFSTMADLQKGVATAGFKAIGDDLANFATGGLVGMVGEQTNDAAPLTADSTTFVTVIYQHPKDAAAFEAYYAATHLPLVGQHAAEIGVTRAELVKFSGNLDGSPATFYRQAKLYFPTKAALQAGTATAGFKAVGDDLGNFADGGLVALVGHVTGSR